MADKRVTDLTTILGSSLASGDLLHIVDISDTTDHASGTSKKLAYSELATQILTGNAATASSAAVLTTARNINGVSFNGSADITVTAAAGTLTGATLAAGVTASSLTSLGTLTALNVGGVTTLTSASANSLCVGPNGATTPIFQVDSSTASAVVGIKITGGASAAGVDIAAVGSGTNNQIRISGQGAAGVVLRVGGSSCITVANTQCAFQVPNRSATSNTMFSFIGLASGTGGSALTASTETHGTYFNHTFTQTFGTGAKTLQREFRIGVPTYAAVAASTVTDAATFAVDGAPIAGTNATLTNTSTFYSAGAAVGSGATNSYGLNIKANTGATNNYAFRFEGAAGELLSLDTNGKIALLATNTAGGTTGAQTINKPAGTVNFAAAATSLVVTNSLCTTSSIIHAVLRTNDSTARIANVVPGSGSFTINLTAAATAETSCGFIILN